MDRVYLAVLQTVKGIGNARLQALVSYFGSARQAWQANKGDLFLSKCLDGTACNNLLERREKIDVLGVAQEWQQKGVNICTLFDQDYPELLKNIYNPPVVLYYRGALPAGDALIAIVGSRKATPYGKNVTSVLAKGLIAAGLGIVSGGARGIDTAAHKGALDAAGYTIAVLGCGVDVHYPPENANLLARIAEKGCVLSEYPPGTLPHPTQFPARNRIINGLSRGVVVVEATDKSGALITADYALEEGREVFAVPGSIFSASSKGTHRLIKQGAKVTECVDDILEEYSLVSHSADDTEPALSPEETSVFDHLDYHHPLCIEEIVTRTKLPLETVTYILLQFEFRGLIAEHSGQRYVRIAREGNK